MKRFLWWFFFFFSHLPHTLSHWITICNGSDFAFRDFAYVARDRTTRRHMCHVFRCDTPAREIANTLRDICKRIMLERSLQAAGSGMSRMAVNRPNNLPNLDRAANTPNGQKLTFHNLYACEFWWAGAFCRFFTSNFDLSGRGNLKDKYAIKLTLCF